MEPHPILFSLGEFNFYTHGLFAVAGIITAAAMSYLIGRRSLHTDYLFDNIVYSILAGIIGAKITYIVLYPEHFASFGDYFKIWEGGLVSYGGFIIGGIIFALLNRWQKQPVAKWFDVLAITFPLGLFFGRLGEFISGENFGVVMENGKNVPIHLYEAFLCLAIFTLMLFVHRRYRDIRDGILLNFSVLLYTGGRFVIDFSRAEKDIVWVLSTGQIVSLLLFIIFLFRLLTSSGRSRKGAYGFIKRFNRKAKTATP